MLWAKALQVFAEIPKSLFLANLISCSAATSAYSKCVRWEQAIGSLQQMCSRLLRCDVITHNGTIAACEKGEELNSTLALLHGFPSVVIQPNVVTHSSVISDSEYTCTRE